MHAGMGSTVLINEQNAYFLSVGDSRAYLIREDSIVQVTKDHSPVREMLDPGIIGQEEAFNHLVKNMVDQVVGSREPVRSDHYRLKMQNNDLLLLCSASWSVS